MRPVSRAAAKSAARRGRDSGYIDRSMPSEPKKPVGSTKSHCMSTITSAVCAGSTSSASSVNTCLPAIVIIVGLSLLRDPPWRTGAPPGGAPGAHRTGSSAVMNAPIAAIFSGDLAR